MYIGVDIGTGSVKVIIIDDDDNVVAEEQQFYAMSHPQEEYFEQDADEVRNATIQTIQKAVASVAQKEKIKSIAFSTAMHSLMAIDENGLPLTQLLLWPDIRSDAQAKKIKEKINGQLYKQSGVPLHPMLPLTKIMWIQEHMPEVFEKAKKFIGIKEYILHHFTNEYFIDQSVATATGMMDITTSQWNPVALSFAQIETDQLAEISSPVCYKQIPASVASYLGLPTDIKIIAGSSDGCMANSGSGITPEKDIAITIGTSAAVRITTVTPINDTSQTLFNYPMPCNYFVSGGASNNGGGVLELIKHEWYCNEISVIELLKKIFQKPAGCNGMVVLPYFFGERAPLWDANAKAVIHGWHIWDNKELVARATLEGIMMNLLLITEKIREHRTGIERIIASGGFTQCTEWLQMTADIFNLPVVSNNVNDASAMGAALLARHVITNQPWTLCNADVEATFEPDTEAHNIYMQNFEVFKSLLPKNN